MIGKINVDDNIKAVIFVRLFTLLYMLPHWISVKVGRTDGIL